MTRLTVSVIIPTYNAAAFLPAALDSVTTQTRPPDEIIIVDDGSTDDTPKLLAGRPEVTVIRQDNAGPSAARNVGVAHATSDLVAFLDADCVWYPGKLERQVAVHEGDDPVDYSFTELEEQIADGFEAPWWSLERQQPESPTHKVSVPSLVMRRSTFHELGGFNEALRAGEDTDFLARARVSPFREARIAEVMGASLVHGGNLSANRERIAVDLPRALHAALRNRKHRSVGSGDVMGEPDDDAAGADEPMLVRLYRRQSYAFVTVDVPEAPEGN